MFKYKTYKIIVAFPPGRVTQNEIRSKSFPCNPIKQLNRAKNGKRKREREKLLGESNCKLFFSSWQSALEREPERERQTSNRIRSRINTSLQMCTPSIKFFSIQQIYRADYSVFIVLHIPPGFILNNPILEFVHPPIFQLLAVLWILFLLNSESKKTIRNRFEYELFLILI